MLGQVLSVLCAQAGTGLETSAAAQLRGTFEEGAGTCDPTEKGIENSGTDLVGKRYVPAKVQEEDPGHTNDEG